MSNSNMSGYVGKLFDSMYFVPEEKAEANNVSPYVCSQAYGRVHAEFDGRVQQDSAQFLTDVLTRFSQEDRAANQLLPGQKSAVESAFEGEERQTVSMVTNVKGNR